MLVPGNFMNIYPTWLAPHITLPEGTTSNHVCMDDDDEHIESEARAEKKRLRDLKNSIPTL